MRGAGWPCPMRRQDRSPGNGDAISRVLYLQPFAHAFLCMERTPLHSTAWSRGSDPAEFLDSFHNRAIFLDEWVHRMLGVIECLGLYQDVGSMSFGHDDHAVLVRYDNISGFDLYSIAHDRDIRSGEAVVPDRRGRHRPKRVDRELHALQLRNIAHASIDDGSGIATR